MYPATFGNDEEPGLKLDDDDDDDDDDSQDTAKNTWGTFRLTYGAIVNAKSSRYAGS